MAISLTNSASTGAVIYLLPWAVPPGTPITEASTPLVARELSTNRDTDQPGPTGASLHSTSMTIWLARFPISVFYHLADQPQKLHILFCYKPHILIRKSPLIFHMVSLFTLSCGLFSTFSCASPLLHAHSHMLTCSKSHILFRSLTLAHLIITFF